MLDVQLVVTGKMEELALAKALDAFCAIHDWAVSFRPPLLVDSLTSARLPPMPLPSALTPGSRPMKTRANKLADLVVATVKERGPPNLVLVVDDVELDNDDQIEIVLRHVRAGFDAALTNATHGERERIAARASFHLARPMIEAWLFPDPNAVKAAGASGPGLWDPTTDAECFAVDDTSYGDWCAVTYPRSPVDSRRHPKRYLQFLTNGQFSETRGGVAALAGLDWGLVPQSPPRMGHLHALLDDLARACGRDYPWHVPNDVATGAGSPSTKVLRNV